MQSVAAAAAIPVAAGCAAADVALSVTGTCGCSALLCRHLLWSALLRDAVLTNGTFGSPVNITKWEELGAALIHSAV